MNYTERIAQMYASYSDDELVRQITFEEGKKARGYNPDTLDLKKRGSNPKICDEIIGDMRAELERRKMATPL